MTKNNRTPGGPEWPTLALIAACYLAWGVLTIGAAALGPWIAVPLLALVLTLHSSLTHEVVHGHPLPSRRLSAAMIFPALTLVMPFARFRDLHLAHHRDPNLTDPYDDPESFYMDPSIWARLPATGRALLRFNNTLLGRMLVGPAISLGVFFFQETRAIAAGDAAVRRAWVLHLAALAPVVLWLATLGTISAGAYLAAAYLGYSILMIRTYLEHQAHERAGARTVIIEDRGPLAFLFLNNNFHAVHHAYPQLPWYELPQFYAARRSEFLRRNLGYAYRSYWSVIRRHLLAAKEPVPHPLRLPE